MVLKVMCGTHLFGLPVASLFPGYVNKTANVHYFLYLALDTIYFSKQPLEDRFAMAVSSRSVQPRRSWDSPLLLSRN